MKTLLAFPPASDPAHPPLGLAALAGYLRPRGHDVQLLDLNLAAYCRLLSRDHLAQCSERIQTRLSELSSRNELDADQAREYRLLAENSFSADFLIEETPRCLQALRQPGTYRSRQGYERAAGGVRRGMELVSAAYYPVRWYPRGFSMSYLPTRSSEVLEAIADRSQNLFLPMMENEAERLVREGLDVLGVSINYYSQLIPGLTLAREVRARLPSCRVVLGGGLWGFFEGKWGALQSLAELADVIIPYEGEQVLHSLLNAVESVSSLTNVPGLLLAQEGFEPRGDFPPPPPLDELPRPDFAGFPLGDYLSPGLLLPYLTSRGCYWARCAFCCHAHTYRRKFRSKSVGRVVAELDHLSDTYGAARFYFTDEAIPIRTAIGLAEHVNDSDRKIEWFVEARIGPELTLDILAGLQRGGCKMLMFGLESGHARVLDLMEKGTSPESIEEVLERCHRVGIRAFAMFFFGFPGETMSEAEATVALVERQRRHLTHIAITNFVLERLSPVFAHQSRYGVRGVEPDLIDDLTIFMDYQLDRGLSREEAAALVDDVKGRPSIAPLVELLAISRTHLAFLPNLDERVETQVELQSQEFHPSIRLAIPNDVLLVETAFDLTNIREALQSPTNESVELGYPTKAAPSPQKTEVEEIVRVQPNSRRYLFDPPSERLVEIDDTGVTLLGACNGNMALGEVLEAIGEHNHEEALSFYQMLYSRGLLQAGPERHQAVSDH